MDKGFEIAASCCPHPRCSPIRRGPSLLHGRRRRARGRGDNPIGQPAEGQRLQPYATGPPQSGEEQAFTAENGRLDLADVLNVVVDTRLECNNASGVDAYDFAGGQRPLGQCAACVDEHPTVALQALHNEPFTAEQADAEAFLKRDTDAYALGRSEKRILLSNAVLRQVQQLDGYDLPWIGRAKRDSFFF